MNQSATQSGRHSALSEDQRMRFVEYIHAQPQAHFTRPQLAQALQQQTGVRFADHYLPVILREQGLRCYKPRPVAVPRSADSEWALIQRLKATAAADRF